MKKDKHRQQSSSALAYVAVVFLGGISALAGAALGMAELLYTPAQRVNELPEKPVPRTVYYILGTEHGGHAAQAKLQAYQNGSLPRLALNEAEINALFLSLAAGPNVPEKFAKSLRQFNARLHENQLQISLPVAVPGIKEPRRLVLQTRFTRHQQQWQLHTTHATLESARLPALAGTAVFSLHLTALAANPEKLAPILEALAQTQEILVEHRQLVLVRR